MDGYKLKVWKRDFIDPLTVNFTGAMNKDTAEHRFQHVCQAVSEGRVVGDPLVFLTSQDVLGGEGFTVEPANTVKVTMQGPDLDLVSDDF